MRYAITEDLQDQASANVQALRQLTDGLEV